MKHIISCFVFALLLITTHATAQLNNTGSVTSGSITLTAMPSVYFVGGNTRLTERHKKMLAHVAKVIRNNPDYQFSLTGYCIGKYQIQQNGLRMNSIVRYLLDKQGIGRHRFEQVYAEEGDCQTIDFTAIKQK